MFALLPSQIMSQKEWGKISDKILQMSRPVQDTSANAIILFDLGKMEITKKFKIKFERHCRIKILKEKGKDVANIVIRYWPEDEIKDIKAHTILSNGVKVALSKDDIFEESYEDFWKQKGFAIPAVEVGSVIEFRYRLESEHLRILDPWYFQNKLFTYLSQLEFIIPSGFQYYAFPRNLTPVEAKPDVEDFDIPGQISNKYQKAVWHLENIPALVKESYLRSLNDYRKSIHFQLIKYEDSRYRIPFVSDWDELAKRLNEKYKYFLREDNKSLLNLLQVEGVDSLPNLRKIKRLYTYVSQNIATEDTSYFYPRKKPKDVLSGRKGNLTEKNLLLVNFLNLAGIEAYPFLISTRSHGQIEGNWPQLTQFNRVILVAISDGDTLYLDTVDKFCPFNKLPPEDLVEQGFLVTPEEGRIINIPSSKMVDMIVLETNAVLTSGGALECHSIIRFEGYRAMSIRKKFLQENEYAVLLKLINKNFVEF